MPTPPAQPALPIIARRRAPAGRGVSDAHTRLDEHDEQITLLADAARHVANGQSELTSAVSDLTRAVKVLEDCTSKFVTDTKDGREILTRMLGEVIERKTGGWAIWIGGALILSARDWVPILWRFVGHVSIAP